MKHTYLLTVQLTNEMDGRQTDLFRLVNHSFLPINRIVQKPHSLKLFLCGDFELVEAVCKVLEMQVAVSTLTVLNINDEFPRLCYFSDAQYPDTFYCEKSAA